jgi:WD repeat-containing protein 61
LVQKFFTYSGHEGSIYTLESGMDPDTFYSGGGDKVVSLWNAGNEKPAGIVATTSVIYCIRLIRERSQLLVGVSGGGFHVIDLIQKKETRYIVHHVNGIFDLSYIPVVHKIVTAGADGSIAVWSEEYQLLQTINLCKEKIRALALNSDQSRVAVACGDGHIRIFTTHDMSAVADFAGHDGSVNSICFHPDGKRLITGGKDAHLRSWNVDNYSLIQEIPAHNYAIYSICFSPDGTWMATGSRDKTVKLWNADNLSVVQRIDKISLDAHSHSVNKVIWLGAQHFISTGDDRKIYEWSLSN